MDRQGLDQMGRRLVLLSLVLSMAAHGASSTEYPEGQSVVPWLLLDLLLFWLVWRGSRPARYALLVLSGIGVVLGLYSLVTVMVSGNAAGPGWASVLLLTASTACLAHPSTRPESKKIEVPAPVG